MGNYNTLRFTRENKILIKNIVPGIVLWKETAKYQEQLCKSNGFDEYNTLI